MLKSSIIAVQAELNKTCTVKTGKKRNSQPTIKRDSKGLIHSGSQGLELQLKDGWRFPGEE